MSLTAARYSVILQMGKGCKEKAAACFFKKYCRLNNTLPEVVQDIFLGFLCFSMDLFLNYVVSSAEI